MPTQQQILDELERRNRDAASVFRVAGGEPGMNPVVSEAIDSYVPSPAPSVSASSDGQTVNAKLGGAMKGVTVPVTPFTPGVPAVTPEPETSSFYRMLLANDDARIRGSEAYQRREKANAARTRIAAVADALASLGNLVGTTQGAFSQPQTYQTPFINEQVAQDRALARQHANMLRQHEQTIRMAQARQEATEDTYAYRQAIEEEKTNRAIQLALKRAELAGQNNAAKKDIAVTQIEGRKELAGINNKSKAEIAAANNASREKVGAGHDAARRYAVDNRGGSGGVGEYTTTTSTENHYETDEFGNRYRTGSTTTRTRTAGGKTETTVTKTPPSRQKKDDKDKKVPPSKRR